MNKQMNPPHVGTILKRAIRERGLSIYKAAQLARISQSSLNLVVNKKRPLSLDMAYRMGKLLGVRPVLLMRIQVDCEIHAKEEEMESDPEYQSIQPVEVES